MKPSSIGFLIHLSMQATDCRAFCPESNRISLMNTVNFSMTKAFPTTVAMVGIEIDPEDRPPSSNTNPSTRFGTPISEDTKKFNKNTVGVLKSVLFDTIFEGRDFARFYALETIARVPYFSYTAALHFYETIGMWRQAKYLKIHFAEDWNEMHHLMIMESLGGSERWSDRFIAQHIAVGYYLLALTFYFWNPTLAYNLNQYIEEHAFATYDTFTKENEEELKKKPAPKVALDYYTGDLQDLYMFDAFQTGSCDIRRPKIDNLYDVFIAIRDDEAEHVKTMTALQTELELSNSHDDGCDIPDDFLYK